MAHIQHLARKRPTVRFFGTECKIADMAHESIERQRIDAENALLRAENADLKRSLAASIQGQHATALRLAELMEREPALVAAIERAEYTHQYTTRTLEMAQRHIDYLQGVVKAQGDEAERRLAEIEAQAARSIESLAEVDSE